MFGSLKRFLPWLVTSTFSLILIFSSSHPSILNVKGNVADVITVITKPIRYMFEWPHLWKENKRLHFLLTELSVKTSVLEGKGRESSRLREMLSFKERSSFDLLAADVTGYSPDPGVQGALINRGIIDGVKKNSPVIVPEGLVGRVYSVGQHSAAIQFITDPNIGVACRLNTSREIGIVHVSGFERLVINGIPITADVEIGEMAFTSGLGGIFPEGLFIGEVKEINPAINGWLLDIILEPAIEFTKLDELFVIIEMDDEPKDP